MGLGATCVAPHCTFTVPPPDLSGADFSPPPDLKPPADLTPAPPDLVPPPDLFGVVFDMTLLPDLATPDLSVTPADLSVAPVDMAAASTDDMSSAIECDHDTQCPNAACGGQVCRWTNTSQSCVAAGTDPQGTDGWCNNDDECKCKGEGATCNLTTLHCTATLPKTNGKDKSGCSVADPLSAGSLALSTLVALLMARRLGRRRAIQ